MQYSTVCSLQSYKNWHDQWKYCSSLRDVGMGKGFRALLWFIFIIFQSSNVDLQTALKQAQWREDVLRVHTYCMTCGRVSKSCSWLSKGQKKQNISTATKDYRHCFKYNICAQNVAKWNFKATENDEEKLKPTCEYRTNVCSVTLHSRPVGTFRVFHK